MAICPWSNSWIASQLHSPDFKFLFATWIQFLGCWFGCYDNACIEWAMIVTLNQEPNSWCYRGGEPPATFQLVGRPRPSDDQSVDAGSCRRIQYFKHPSPRLFRALKVKTNSWDWIQKLSQQCFSNAGRTWSLLAAAFGKCPYHLQRQLWAECTTIIQSGSDNNMNNWDMLNDLQEKDAADMPIYVAAAHN